MVRNDEAALYGSPFKRLIDQALIRAKRRELTVSLLMQKSLQPTRCFTDSDSNDVIIRDQKAH